MHSCFSLGYSKLLHNDFIGDKPRVSDSWLRILARRCALAGFHPVCVCGGGGGTGGKLPPKNLTLIELSIIISQ